MHPPSPHPTSPPRTAPPEPSDQLPLTRILWRDVEELVEAIVAHPFLRGLTDGSLPEESFRYYVVQDAHYLRDYARALAVVAARCSDESSVATFARHAAGAIEVERTLHTELLDDLGIPAGLAASTPVGPATLAYTSYLLATAYAGAPEEGIAAVLPCYWIYWEVGTRLVELGSPDRRFQRWIDTYAGEEFGGVVQEVLDLTDALTPPTALRERMRAHFATTSRYEWMFWDAAWQRLHWPDPTA